ncbi:hypothetical protein [Streptomyces sp. NRRL S-87]|uniref:hypothetical protein n=1 Tax=Streptomyces sp. NRRL S-87 TaxID=1463920 RepID=UPI0004C14246|nr:hypothetical protein [Streptomyces sp. NRRL S-87]
MTYEFPPRLCALQLQLHRVRADSVRLSAELPWSVEPMPGWPASEHRFSHRGDVPDSAGYTPEQKAAQDRLRKRELRLAAAVGTDPFWGTLAGEDRVKARMALKHADPTPE